MIEPKATFYKQNQFHPGKLSLEPKNGGLEDGFSIWIEWFVGFSMFIFQDVHVLP